jgi:CBS domain-containing protein
VNKLGRQKRQGKAETGDMLVKDFMSKTVYKVKESSKVSDAVRLMAEKRIGGVLVYKEGDGSTPVSIFTERDLIGKVLGKGLDLSKESVGHHASAPLKFVNPQSTERQILDFMIEENVRRVPVLESGRVIGMVTCVDLLRAMAAAKENS